MKLLPIPKQSQFFNSLTKIQLTFGRLSSPDFLAVCYTTSISQNTDPKGTASPALTMGDTFWTCRAFWGPQSSLLMSSSVPKGMWDCQKAEGQEEKARLESNTAEAQAQTHTWSFKGQLERRNLFSEIPFSPSTALKAGCSNGIWILLTSSFLRASSCSCFSLAILWARSASAFLRSSCSFSLARFSKLARMLLVLLATVTWKRTSQIMIL